MKEFAKFTGIAISSIEVSNVLYVRENGKAPRGYGYWAFSMGVRKSSPAEKYIFWAEGMTYGEAVKLAKLEAQKRGVRYVYALP